MLTFPPAGAVEDARAAFESASASKRVAEGEVKDLEAQLLEISQARQRAQETREPENAPTVG
jgi:hypothetical protein